MNKLLLTLLLFLISLCFLCCTDNSKTVEISFEFKKIPLDNKIKEALSMDYLSQLNFSENEQQYLTKFYAGRKFNAVFVNDSTMTNLGNKMESYLKHKLAFGIPESRNYHSTNDTDNFIQKELKLTLGFAYLLNDLKNGFLQTDTILYKETKAIDLENYTALIKSIDSSNLKSILWQTGPADSNYQLLASYLFKEYFKGKIDRNSYKINSIKEDSLKAVKLTSEALFHKGYLSEITVDSTRMTDALKQFQLDNELADDGVIGKNTAYVLNESIFNRLNRIALAMEKIRMKKSYPEKYILVNLPEYNLKFYINDSIKAEHNIVIGKWGNETPQLSASIRKIIVYPYWRVPYSISSKEILPAAQRNPNYFAKHNYKIYRKGEEVDPLTVNWKKIKENAFPYVVVQEPGPKNSLGIIKFDMPNSQSIYIHDTPSKSLFGTKTRAYSHGCMRCDKPIDLAKAILERDENYKQKNPIIADSLDSIFARNLNYEIPLLQYIPVFMEYNTVIVKDQQVKVFPDIYGREGEYIKLFTKS